MSFIILASSLNPVSNSRIMARFAYQQMRNNGAIVDLIDLTELSLPLCDGSSAYGHPNVKLLGSRLAGAKGVLISTPVYNFDANAAIKNAIELTGRNGWLGKTVGFLCAAGGTGSYMSIMSLANSLMLDFRCHIVPRFVYATEADFDDATSTIRTDAVRDRISELTLELARVTTALDAHRP